MVEGRFAAGEHVAGRRDAGWEPSSLSWRGLSEHTVTIWRVRATVCALGVLAALWLLVTVAYLRDVDSTGIWFFDWSITADQLITLAGGVSALVVIVWAVLVSTTQRRCARWRWHVGEDRIVVERGWWRHRRLQAPTVAVHTLDVRAGPLLRHWGVQKVRLYSSGPIGSVTMPVLADQVVAALRLELGLDD